MKIKQSRLALHLLAFAFGAVLGIFYYRLSWTQHLPYIGLHWLGRLIGADGESGYDADFYESMIDFAVIALLVEIGISALICAALERRSQAKR